MAHNGAIGPWSLDSATQWHLVRHHDIDEMIELVWSVPAMLAFIALAVAIPPRRGWRLSWSAFGACVLAVVAYSWVRWIPDLAHLKLRDGTNFGLAIALAAVGGLTTGMARR